jgi:predicted RNA polymerase sigma factor
VTDQLLDITSEHLLRDLAPQVLGVVIRRFRDFAAAEDAVQEALIAAALRAFPAIRGLG